MLLSSLPFRPAAFQLPARALSTGSRPFRTLPSVRARSSRTPKFVCAPRRPRELRRCIRQASSPPSNFGRRVASDRRSLFPGGPVRGKLHRVVVPACEFQRRADRILFRSRRASLGCFQFRPVGFLYWCLHSAKRLTALTPLSLLSTPRILGFVNG